MTLLEQEPRRSRGGAGRAGQQGPGKSCTWWSNARQQVAGGCRPQPRGPWCWLLGATRGTNTAIDRGCAQRGCPGCFVSPGGRRKAPRTPGSYTQNWQDGSIIGLT